MKVAYGFLWLLILSLLITERVHGQRGIEGKPSDCLPAPRSVDGAVRDPGKDVRHRALAEPSAARRGAGCAFLNGERGQFEALSRTRSQARPLEDRVVEEIAQRWDGDEWVNLRRTFRTYDEDGNLIEEIDLSWDGEEWVNRDRDTYSFDGEGHMTGHVEEEWDGTGWVGEYRSTFTFDSEGKEVESLLERWENGAWENSSRSQYTYDDDGNLTESRFQFWEDGDWANDSLGLYTYDNEGNETEALLQRWVDEEWVNYYLILQEYDEDGNLTEYVSQIWDPVEEEWANEYRWRYTYDADGNQTTFRYETWTGSSWRTGSGQNSAYDEEGRLVEHTFLDVDGQQLVNDVRYTLSYDEEGNLVEEVYQRWENGEWVNVDQRLYGYDAEGKEVAELGQRWENGEWVDSYRSFTIPEAMADAATTGEDTPVVIDVLANDAGLDPDEATVSVTTPPEHGTATVGEDGTITYTPDAEFAGEDSFTYEVDTGEATSEGTVTVTVTGVNDAPSAAVITSPEEDATLVIGGAEGEPPADPATTITIAWEEGEDPEGEPLSYRWELALDEDFEEIIATVELEAQASAKAEVEVTYRMIAAALDEAGVELGDEVELFHRVVASDGSQEMPSEVLRITLVRGTLVAAEGTAELPQSFALHGAYPNPFNPQAVIPFDVPEAGEVTLRVFDALGREVALLVKGTVAPGRHEVTWQAMGMPSGLYLVRMEASGRTFTRQVVLMK